MASLIETVLTYPADKPISIAGVLLIICIGMLAIYGLAKLIGILDAD